METGQSKKNEKCPRKKNNFRSGCESRKTGENIVLQKETWMIIGGIMLALTILTIVFSFLWGTFLVLFYWVMGVLAIFFTRRTNMWQMGIELHFPLVFYTAYVFGPFFAMSMALVAYAAVWKVRPDQGHGVMIQMTSLSIMMGMSRLMLYLYGLNISASEFIFAFIISIVVCQVIDLILSKMFCPAPLIKIIIIHSLDMMLNTYIAMLIGYKIITYFISIA